MGSGFMCGPEGRLGGREMELRGGRKMGRGTRGFGNSLIAHFGGSGEQVWGEQEGKEMCSAFGGWCAYNEGQAMRRNSFQDSGTGDVWSWPAGWARWGADSWKTTAQGSLEDSEAWEGAPSPPRDSCLVWRTPVPTLLHSSLKLTRG